jgi:predicted dienelactone hydrolase
VGAGYGPLANFWAAHGFVVIQPTRLDSNALGLREEDLPDAPLFWRDRATDMTFILDHLDDVEAAVPGLAGLPRPRLCRFRSARSRLRS